MINRIHLAITLSLFLALVVCGVFHVFPSGEKELSVQDKIEKQPEYPLLANRLFSENRNDIFVNFMPLRQALREYVEKQPDDISVYFEYLPSGSSIGIEDTDEIEMASLVKLPTVMAIYDKIAKGELSKDTVLTLKEDQINTKYGTFWQNGAGTKISLHDAILKTLIESDNTTYEMLFSQLSVEDRVRMFQQLDIRIELEGDEFLSYISAKSYASILKSLYLSSYLSKEASSELLTILSESPRDGIAKISDNTISISHKTGILERNDGIDVKNDCGIVYVPRRPYILCILVHGEDDTKVETYMNMISTMIYGYIIKITMPNTSIPLP